MSPLTPLRRRGLLAWPWMAGGGAALAATHATGASSPRSERMPGDPPEHHVVYQVNQADADYIEHILGSIGALIAKYEDNVAIAVVAFGPGIHLLARKPLRHVPIELRERAAGQAKDYGVRYIACGNTMKSLHWGPEDIVGYAGIEEVGAATLMELQEQGWAYVAW